MQFYFCIFSLSCLPRFVVLLISLRTNRNSHFTRPCISQGPFMSPPSSPKNKRFRETTPEVKSKKLPRSEETDDQFCLPSTAWFSEDGLLFDSYHIGLIYSSEVKKVSVNTSPPLNVREESSWDNEWQNCICIAIPSKMHGSIAQIKSYSDLSIVPFKSHRPSDMIPSFLIDWAKTKSSARVVWITTVD